MSILNLKGILLVGSIVAGSVVHLYSASAATPDPKDFTHKQLKKWYRVSEVPSFENLLTGKPWNCVRRTVSKKGEKAEELQGHFKFEKDAKSQTGLKNTGTHEAKFLRAGKKEFTASYYPKRESRSLPEKDWKKVKELNHEFLLNLRVTLDGNIIGRDSRYNFLFFEKTYDYVYCRPGKTI